VSNIIHRDPKVSNGDIEHWERVHRGYIEEYEWSQWNPEGGNSLFLDRAKNCLRMAILCRHSKILDDHCER
jgi:hypothetical protein